MKHEISLFYSCGEVSEVEVHMTFTASEWCEFSASPEWEALLMKLGGDPN